jgi:hypothetical protein
LSDTKGRPTFYSVALIAHVKKIKQWKNTCIQISNGKTHMRESGFATD